MKVPFLDLRSQHRALAPELNAAFERIVRDAAFVGGPEVEGFEEEFARYCEVDGSVGVGSGTDALRFAYLAMDVKAGDEVITVPNTFIATTEALTQAGGVPVFVDVRDDTLQMDPALVEAAITPRTVGIVPVHLFGTPVDFAALEAIAEAHGLWIVEDAAQAHGARYRGRRVGSLGALGAFSFYPGKNLGACGEAGAVTGNDPERLRHVRLLREHGQPKKYFHEIEGYNGRLDALQAAFLRIKLAHLDAWGDARRVAAERYREALRDVPDVRPVAVTPGTEPVYHLFVVRAPERDRLQEFLGARGIATGLHYPVPLHLQPAYAGRGEGPGSFPVCESAAEEILSLPMFPEITEDQVAYVVDGLREFFAGRGHARGRQVTADSRAR